jgi:hypothetical protein
METWVPVTYTQTFPSYTSVIPVMPAMSTATGDPATGLHSNQNATKLHHNDGKSCKKTGAVMAFLTMSLVMALI